MKRLSFDDVVVALYQAPTDISLWAPAIEQVGLLVNARNGGQFHIWDSRNRRMLFSSMPAWQAGRPEQEYNERYAAIDPRRELTDDAAVGAWRFDEDFFDATYISHSEIYQDFLRSYEIGYSAGVKLHASDDAIAALGIFKKVDQGGFETRDRTLLARLSRHLVCAANLTLALKEARQQAALGATALDAVTYPLAIVDRHLRVLYHNRAAEALWRGGETVAARAGFIALTDANAQRALRAMVIEAVERGIGNIAQVRSAKDRITLRCHVTPLCDASELSASGMRAVMLAFTPAAKSISATALLMRAFGLTGAECRVALALQQGRSLEEIALAHGVALGTVRAQMKQIFAKTDTHRQTDLALLLQAALAVGAAEASAPK